MTIIYLMTTEQVPFFLRHRPAQQERKQPQKGSLEPAQVQYHNRHGNHMSSSHFQSRRHETHAVFAFRQAETPLNFYAFIFIYVRLLLSGTVSFFGLPSAGTKSRI